ncbi:MAG TPA: hypothetical protein VJI67_02345 [archaeon]|nr:hypothetical protein [archaeon]
MHRVVFLKVGGRNLHLLKLLGALLVFVAFLKVLSGAADVFESTSSINAVNDCLASAELEQKAVCQEQAAYFFGPGPAVPRLSQESLSLKQVTTIASGPLVSMLWWFAILVFGLMLYKAGRVFVPIEEQDFVLQARQKRKGRKK